MKVLTEYVHGFCKHCNYDIVWIDDESGESYWAHCFWLALVPMDHKPENVDDGALVVREEMRLR